MAALAEPEPLRIFNDSVHGPIQLDPLLVMIIDTPQFQRLREIKQLGVCYWVYPGASHNRFEHCIGSSYICSEMINKLRSVHPNEKDLITDYESLCLRIAGLCRDLGYGPFSHFFHEVLVPKLMDSRAQTSSDHATKWARDASCKMFDFMLKENPKLKDALNKKLNLGSNKANSWQEFIKDLIHGKDSKDVKERCSFEGSDNLKKSFLYEIVSNKRTRIDCNKFDYISRDCHNVGVQSNFDWRRYILNIRIKIVRGQVAAMKADKSESELQIHVRDKDYLYLNDLFYARWSLYHRVYRHKTKAGIEDMLSEAILKVDAKLKISHLIKDDSSLKEDDESMRRYTKLTDHRILYQILDLEEQSEEASSSSAQGRSQSEQETGDHAPRRNQSEEARGVPAQESNQSEQATGSRAQQSQIKEAKELLQNIQQRKLYKFCGEAKLKDPCSGKAYGNKKKYAKEIADKSNSSVSEGRVFISFAYFHFGKEDKNPLKDLPRFTKSLQQQTTPANDPGNEVEQQKPESNTTQKFHECYIRVYAKPGQNYENVQAAFKKWCDCNKDKLIKGSLYLNDSGKNRQPVQDP